MRIVHEVVTPMAVSGGGKPYVNLPGKQGYSSSQVNIVMCEDAAANHPELPEGMFGGDEVIHIEGDGKYIIEMLEDALRVLKLQNDYQLDRLGEVRDTGCPDGCDGIEKSNGNHAITCPKHVNYEVFKKERENGIDQSK